MWFQHWIGKKSPRREFRGLYSAEQLQQALRRERARADRFEQTLSLLSLGVSSARTGRDTLVEAAAVLRRRLRLSDEAGWLDRRHIGVLMPNTPPWGAWTLADELCLAFRPCVPLPQCRVYSYPSDWFATGEHSSVGADRGSEDEGRTAAMEPLFFQGLPWWKRAFDILAAGLALLAHVPILLGIAVLIKLTSRGPVLFRQTRVGLGGRPFTIYKFRTMFVDAERLKDRLLELNERDGPVFKIKHDPRVTLAGRLLRKTSLDELPQLINVLLGDMSLVGPRPPLPEEVAQYEPWQQRRLEITPGITCIWQVRGRCSVSFAEWVRLDLQYMGQRTLWTDVKLLAQTIPVIVNGRGGC